ncbi:AraC family transcriptional regulator [Flavobacterium jejuense]|uniref:AraC family transcriptional regulator n=1 Tax=Flavobacterium jejuense TaxID=1544455 RepID=A0ABX0IR26_9FLAO|nr:AraC family transcriptional regulator [Flavobacterium jejuense]NHN25998.1 AraC family transcriptional regulator [Flavobacterium jejuense]
MLFDTLEYITIEKQTTSFPKHFHETFCISLIHQGVEQIEFENHSLFTEAGSISITNPYEIHSNPIIDEDSCLKFDTIYVPNAIMKSILNGENIKFITRQITSKKANEEFLLVKKAIDSKNAERIELHLSEFANTLKCYSQENEEEYSNLNFDTFNPIIDYIETHIFDKFNLNELSKMAHINKFGFAKKFKVATGMTPMNYILMRKIFSSKKAIQSDTELTDIAYQYGFTDMAHYSKTFKRFIGISPKQYKESTLVKTK